MNFGIVDSIPSKCDEIQSFDAFVLFDNADHKFILEELLPKIEGDTELRLCLPARDLDIGNQMYDEQLKYMIKRYSANFTFKKSIYI